MAQQDSGGGEPSACSVGWGLALSRAPDSMVADLNTEARQDIYTLPVHQQLAVAHMRQAQAPGLPNRAAQHVFSAVCKSAAWAGPWLGPKIGLPIT